MGVTVMYLADVVESLSSVVDGVGINNPDCFEVADGLDARPAPDR